MHCGVMVTGYNQGDWPRLMAGEYDRPPDIPDHVHMDETLRLGELVEPLGFDSIWATEHYGSAYSMQPNPLQYLAYWAGRTSRVDLGTAVVVAPWWNPVRLGERAVDARHPPQGSSPAPRHRARRGTARVRVARHPDRGVAHLLLRRHQRDPSRRRRRALHLRRAGLQDPADHHPAPGPPQGRPHHADQGRVHHRDVGAPRRRERSRPDVRVRRRLRGDDRQGAAVQPDPQRAGARRPTNRRRSCGCTAPRPRTQPRRAGSTSTTSCSRRNTTTSSGTTPASRTSRDTRATPLSQSADVGRADTSFAARRATQPIGTPDEIIERIRSLQWAISLEEVVLHFFYGGMPPDKAEASLRLFAEKVLPAVQEMDDAHQPRVARGRHALSRSRAGRRAAPRR